MHLYLVHHGEAVPGDVDSRRPLSTAGRQATETLARACAGRGVRPVVVWHSGKLRARETAELFWRECNALADLSAVRDLQPGDPPERMRDRLLGETRDILIAGHFPHLPGLLSLLTDTRSGPIVFPPHGIVALGSDEAGLAWREEWRDAPGSGWSPSKTG